MDSFWTLKSLAHKPFTIGETLITLLTMAFYYRKWRRVFMSNGSHCGHFAFSVRRLIDGRSMLSIDLYSTFKGEDKSTL